MARHGLLTFTPVLAFAGLSAMFAFGVKEEADAIRPGALDRPMPEFSLAPMAGTEAGFASTDLQGRVVLINVFAAWCSSCRAEHPKLLELAQSGEVPIYGVNWKDAKGAGKLFLSRSGDPYVGTGDDSMGMLGEQLNVTGVPETYVVDAQGRLRYRHLGPITDQIWADILQPLISELESAT